ncbi:hypothetical protein OROGR_020884 [Orobanche gracilis]
MASGIAFVLGAWRPLQLLLSSKIGSLPLFLLLGLGSASFHVPISAITRLGSRKKSSAGVLPVAISCHLVSALTLQSVLSCAAIALHALAEGLALGVAAPKAYGLGRHMILPVSSVGRAHRVHGSAICHRGDTRWDRLQWAGPRDGCRMRGLFPCFAGLIRRAVRLDRRRTGVGLIVGLVSASV